MWGDRLRNYLSIGARALTRKRAYAVINLGGLAIGFAACLMLLLYVRYETGYDRWLPDAANIYQVQSSYSAADGGRARLQMSPYAAGPALRADFPQIRASVYVMPARPVISAGAQALAAHDFVFVDNLFFDVLPLPFAAGDPGSALRQPGSLVLSETQAGRFFGTASALGRTLTITEQGVSRDYRVTGVLRDLPRNSHLRLGMIARVDPAAAFAADSGFLTSWGSNSGWNYVALRPGADPAALRAALPAWERRHIPDRDVGGRAVNQGGIADWDLVNVRDIHLGEAQAGAMRPGNDARTIGTFTIVALLILFMACINYTNLATAWASQRAREVAVRKVLGANFGQLLVQFLSESLLVAAVAMLIALSLVELLLPSLSAFLDADLAMTYFGDGGMLLPVLALAAIVGVVGGLYPALHVSRLRPARVLKTGGAIPEGGAGRLRSALVVIQFAVSIGLVICTWVVHDQTVLARTADPGFRRDGLIQISGIGRPELASRSDALVREIGRIDGVVSVGRSSIGISTPSSNWSSVQIPGRGDPVSLGSYTIDEGFFRTMGMEMTAGRPLATGRPLDRDPRPAEASLDQDRAFAARGINVVINEFAARQLGFARPADALGAQLRMDLASDEAGLVPIAIVGVVRDTRFRSVRQPLDPIVFRLAATGPNHALVRYAGDDPVAVRERVAAVWRRLARDVPFDAVFSEDIVAELYQAERARSQVFAAFALLAVIIACLGLFGLAAFAAERRTREIGLRKVLGARTPDIVRLLAWQFSRPVILANLIAWPVAWWVMRDWLDGFDVRVELGPTPFVMAGLLALALAVGTVAGHAFKVARASPILALRYE